MFFFMIKIYVGLKYVTIFLLKEDSTSEYNKLPKNTYFLLPFKSCDLLIIYKNNHHL